VTYLATEERTQTSLTLQDGCFGAGTLMRIAAMSVKPEKDTGSTPGPDQAPLPADSPAAGAGKAADEAEAASSFASAAHTAGSSSRPSSRPQEALPERQSG
jgi:hypothetical protein